MHPTIRDIRPGDGEGCARAWVDAGRYYSARVPEVIQVPDEDGLAEWFDDRYFDLRDLGDRHRDESFGASPVPADVPFADGKKFVGVDFDFNVQGTVRPAAATE